VSRTGILENIVTTLVETRQKTNQEHAKDTGGIMHTDQDISNQSLSPRRNQDALQSSSTAQKITLYTQTKKMCKRKLHYNGKYFTFFKYYHV
jgi:hypothetical protein